MTLSPPPPPPGRTLFRERLRQIFRGAVDCFVPPVCASCARLLLEKEYGLCADCEARLERPAEPLCEFCGRAFCRPLPTGRCERCAHLPNDVFDRARAAFFYRGPMVDVIQNLKYRRHEELAEWLGRRVFVFLSDTWPAALEVEMLAAAPLHPLRFLRRGYNQAEAIALALSRLSGIPYAAGALRRIRATPTQTRLNDRERWENVAGAFEATRAPDVAGRSLLLVDDVLTTGATLASAARALRAAGAGRILALAAARAA